MKPAGPAAAFAAPTDAAPPAMEAAPARRAVRALAACVFALLLLLAGRAVQLAFAGDPLAARAGGASAAAAARADLTDRNGVLLATNVRAYALTAAPQRVWNPRETADALLVLFPDMDRAATERRLADTDRRLVYLRRGLTPGQRDRALALGLGGVGAEAEERRVYPNGSLAAHALGFTDRDLKALAGAEIGLDSEIRAAAAEGRAVRLSLDIRIQHAVESELDAAARAFNATGGSAIVLDARSGETLAFASWPSFDPNEAGAAPADARRDRAAGDVHELGSTMKPFTLAMALEERLTNPAERFDLIAPFAVDGLPIHDHEPVRGAAGLREILAHSSNIGAAKLALRVGAQRQRQYLERLGLTEASPLEVGRHAPPLAPPPRSRRDVAGLGFGYGLAASSAALAGAYTVFANEGARVEPTLLARDPADPVERTPVFSPETTRAMLPLLRAVVSEGTGRAADVPGLGIAGKTGTAEKLGEGEAGAGYQQGRNFSSFAAIFPVSEPRYVIVLALDEPSGSGLVTGGAVAAPAVGRVAARIAPMLGLRLEPRNAQ